MVPVAALAAQPLDDQQYGRIAQGYNRLVGRTGDLPRRVGQQPSLLLPLVGQFVEPFAQRPGNEFREADERGPKGRRDRREVIATPRRIVRTAHVRPYCDPFPSLWGPSRSGAHARDCPLW